MSPDTVRRWWPTWTRARSFPKPLALPAGKRKLLRWDAEAVDRWRGALSDGRASRSGLVDWDAVVDARLACLRRGIDPDTGEKL